MSMIKQKVFIALLMLSQSVWATTADLIASATSGTAPMAVHFDATGTADTEVDDPFRELRYDFNFGDPTSGNWQYSGLSKNTQSGGPLAAHVYDNPGTYTAILNVGNDTEKVTINVQDPNTVFPGGKTVCLSRNTDMNGCPSGAKQIRNISVWPTIKSNKRYMLRAGQNFSALGQLSTGQIHNARITAFGSGAKPITGVIYLQPEVEGYGPNWISNVDVIGLSAARILHGLSGSNILFYKNEINTAPGGIGYGGAYHWYKENGYYSSSLLMNKNFFIIENVSEAGDSSHNGDGQSVWMGNRIGNSNQHNSRLWQVYKTFIAHNNYFGNSSNGGAAVLKIHSTGTDPVNPNTVNPVNHKPRSKYLVIADNLLNSDISSGVYVTLAIEPQTESYAEGIEDVIEENNTHTVGTWEHGFTDGSFGGRNITRRGATIVGDVIGYRTGNNMSGAPSFDGPYFMNVAMPPPPD